MLILCTKLRIICCRLLSVVSVLSLRCEITTANGNTLFMTFKSSWRRGHVSRTRRISGEFRVADEATSKSIRLLRFICMEKKSLR